AVALRLLLVRPCQGERGAVVAYARPRAIARLRHPGGARRPRVRPEAACRQRHARARRAARLPCQAPLVLGQAPEDRFGTHRLYRIVAGWRSRASDGRDRDPDRWRHAALADAALDLLGRRACRTAAQPARLVTRAPRPAGRPADRCLRFAVLCVADPEGAGQQGRGRDRRGTNPVPADAWRRGDIDAEARGDGELAERRAVQQLADRRRPGDAQDLPPRDGWRAPRGRDGSLPDGARLCQLADPAG